MMFQTNMPKPAAEELPVPEPKFDEGLVERLVGFALGELTWAQVEGWTPEMLYKYAELGVTQLKVGRVEEAEEILRFCYHVNPRDWYFSYVLGQIALQRGDLSLARAYLEESVSQPIRRAEAHLLLALVYGAQGEEEAARRQIEEALAAAKRYEKYLRTGSYPLEEEEAKEARGQNRV